MGNLQLQKRWGFAGLTFLEGSIKTWEEELIERRGACVGSVRWTGSEI